MRTTILGLIVGGVLGMVLGATVIAPRLQRTPDGDAASSSQRQSPADIARELPRALVGSPDVSLKMASAYEAGEPIAGALARRIDTRVWEISSGQVEIRFYPPGALVATSDLVDAVSSGAIDSAFVPPGSGSNAAPALQLFAGFPFGPGAGEFLAWLNQGGGKDLYDGLTEQNNIHGMLCGLLPASSFGWFRTDLQTPQDLKGMRINASGLRARLLTRLGAETTDLPPADLLMAVEQGTIGAVAGAPPAVDRLAGLQKWLLVYYPQGWSQPLTGINLIINLKRWSLLSGTQRAQIEATCRDNIVFGLAMGEAGQFQALKDLFAAGVRLERLPPSFQDTAEQAWQQLVQQLSRDDDAFRRVWQSLAQFRSEYSVWRDLGRF